MWLRSGARTDVGQWPLRGAQSCWSLLARLCSSTQAAAAAPSEAHPSAAPHLPRASRPCCAHHSPHLTTQPAPRTLQHAACALPDGLTAAAQQPLHRISPVMGSPASAPQAPCSHSASQPLLPGQRRHYCSAPDTAATSWKALARFTDRGEVAPAAWHRTPWHRRADDPTPPPQTAPQADRSGRRHARGAADHFDNVDVHSNGGSAHLKSLFPPTSVPPPSAVPPPPPPMTPAAAATPSQQPAVASPEAAAGFAAATPPAPSGPAAAPPGDNGRVQAPGSSSQGSWLIHRPDSGALPPTNSSVEQQQDSDGRGDVAAPLRRMRISTRIPAAPAYMQCFAAKSRVNGRRQEVRDKEHDGRWHRRFPQAGDVFVGDVKSVASPAAVGLGGDAYEALLQDATEQLARREARRLRRVSPQAARQIKGAAPSK